MAKAVADVNNPDEKQGGFASDDSDITGFSHMHDSGTGGVRPFPKCGASSTDNFHSHHRWATSLYSPKLDAQEISSIVASSPRPIEHLKESMAVLKPTQDILLLV